MDVRFSAQWLTRDGLMPVMTYYWSGSSCKPKSLLVPPARLACSKFTCLGNSYCQVRVPLSFHTLNSI